MASEKVKIDVEISTSLLVISAALFGALHSMLVLLYWKFSLTVLGVGVLGLFIVSLMMFALHWIASEEWRIPSRTWGQHRHYHLHNRAMYLWILGDIATYVLLSL